MRAIKLKMQQFSQYISRKIWYEDFSDIYAKLLTMEHATFYIA